MPKIVSYIKKLSKSQKIICLILILSFIFMLSIGIPSLARFKNRNISYTITVWDGSTANNYRSGDGTQNNPYTISNGSELAFFSEQLATNDYANKYFALGNDIMLNDGIFNYDAENGIQYTINNQTYYLDEYTNKYYDNINRTGTEIGTINPFNSLNNFKGIFDAKSFRIYGLYITDSAKESLGLFTKLSGSINDLYVENSIIYGGIVTGGIASETDSATISNSLYDGYVIGRSIELNKNVSQTLTSPTINIQKQETTNTLDLTNNIPLMGGEIVSTSITGNYLIDGPSGANNTVKINGNTVTELSFDIDLGTSIMNSVPVITSTDSNETVTLTFSNLKYNIVYKYGVSSGIVALPNNTIIDNTINKANIYGYTVGGGLVGVTTSSLSINKSYNIGNITSEYASGGLIGIVEKSNDNIILSKSYNTGSIVSNNIGGITGIINNNTGLISINNVFNTSVTNYNIGTVNNTNVNVSDSYYTNGGTSVKSGVLNGYFTSTTIDNLKTKDYLITNLEFNEFVDFDDLETNSENVWVYEDNGLPILFIDDINNPIANINISGYSWNNLSYKLSNIKLDSNIAFSIESTDQLRPIKDKYYYISNSLEPLTQTQISQISTWTPYSNVVELANEDYYVIYVKVVDYNDNITILNTDSLILDLPGISASINLDNNKWSNLRSNLENVYINTEKNITIDANNNKISTVSTIKYYVTDQILNSTELNSLDNSNWTTYIDNILLNEVGKHVIYAQIVDSYNYKTYINTDYIVYNGYSENDLIIGKNSSSYIGYDNYINNKSSINLNISYSDLNASPLNGHTHNLISSILLPQNTKLKLIDKARNKMYEYQIPTDQDIYNYNNSCNIEDIDCIKVASYPFTLFKEVGVGGSAKPFVEDDYYGDGKINEDFTFILDLSDTNITNNYDNVKLYMQLNDSNGNNVRPTLYSTIKSFNVYSNISGSSTSASLYLNTNYNGDPIELNSNSSTDININSGISYKTIDSKKIIDTTFEDKEIGLAIKLVDSDNNIMGKDYLKNIAFKLGETIYSPKSDNIVHINLNNGINDTDKTLTIITSNNSSNLAEGTYYFKISNYASYDGTYANTEESPVVSIPVNIINNVDNITYGFDVITDNAYRIINKSINNFKVAFDILQNGPFKNPNIRVSLYKKDNITAYNQNYSIVNLQDYVSDNLMLYGSNVYYVSTSPVKYSKYQKLYNHFELNLITSNFENTGYKFKFDLYDDSKRIGTIEKYFIIK